MIAARRCYLPPCCLLGFCVLLAGLLSVGTGCPSNVAPGSEQSVVTAEDSVAAAFHSVRDNENWAQARRDEIRQKAPDADKAFDQVRKDDEPTFSAAWGAIRVYKETRTPAARATMLQKADAAAALRTKAETARAQAVANGVSNGGNP
jgi:hypothetical protein